MNTSPLPTLADIEAAIARVADPEFGLSIVDLGLVYDLRVEGNEVQVTMTLTSFYCPAGEVILGGVKAAAESVPGVSRATVQLTWEPPWTPDCLTPAGRAQLGWDTPRVEA
jgi:metal-sulfur cluster biosynthetic enzyme